MKLLKLSIQSIILLYQLLVREHRKKSRLRSAATPLLLGLAFSHDYVSKNSSAFTCQTLYKRCWGCFFFSPLQPTSWSGSTRTCSLSRKNILCSTITHLVSLKASKVMSMLPLTPDARRREMTQKLKVCCSARVLPTPRNISQLGTWGQYLFLTCPKCSSRWPHTSSQHHTQGLTP